MTPERLQQIRLLAFWNAAGQWTGNQYKAGFDELLAEVDRLMAENVQLQWVIVHPPGPDAAVVP